MVHGHSIYFCHGKMKGKRGKTKIMLNFKMKQPLTFSIVVFLCLSHKGRVPDHGMNVTDLRKINPAYIRTDAINHTFTEERECINKNSGFHPW